jgi:hypothetical protein
MLPPDVFDYAVKPSSTAKSIVELKPVRNQERYLFLNLDKFEAIVERVSRVACLESMRP